MGGKLRQIFSGHMGSTGVGMGFRFLTRFIDLLLAPFVLQAPVLYAYLAARVWTLMMPLALNLLGRKAAPQLITLVQRDAQTPFHAAAARVNLSYLIISGGVGVAMLGAVPLLMGRVDGLHSSFEDILLWLVIGQAAPVLFGATGLLMRVVDRGAFYDVLQGMTALLFVCSIVVLDMSKGSQVAQTFAAAQLTQAALCAMLLTQCGVWPGLTALLQRQIKIF